jgi:hypothetical protein
VLKQTDEWHLDKVNRAIPGPLARSWFGRARARARDQDARPATAHACPVCGASAITDHPEALSACQTCLHIFQSDRRVTVVYDAAYAHQYDHRPHQAMSALRWRFIQQWLMLPLGSRILDIGYGNGAFLKFALRCGMDVVGFDVHGEDFGVPTLEHGDPGDFDLICFFDSLEHLPGFDFLFTLRPAAVVVSIPNTPDFLLETPRLWRHFKPGEHLHYFSRRSLDVLMRQWGLTKLAEGCPEDVLRGKSRAGRRTYDNIYSAIYCRHPRG